MPGLNDSAFKDRKTLRYFCFALLICVPCDLSAAERPNIIIILGDDMGYSDLGCYGGEILTPALNGLADGGLRFTQFYNTARCCPTRASLLTGLYPHQAGVGHMMTDRGHDGYRGDLNRHCVTIAEVLNTAGYRSYMTGKWHVTKVTDPDGPKDNWPCQRGFAKFYGTIHGAGSFYDPNSLTRDNTAISPYADPEYQSETYYYTNAISDHAVRYIEEHLRETNDQPFFLYVAYTAAHWPMHALDQDIEKYRGRYDAGYQPIRDTRFARMKELGLVDPEWDLSPTAESWDAVTNKVWETRCMEVYAAMIDCMDQGIGRIVETLRAQNALDNTLIFFLQDNGGCAETLGRQPQGEFHVRPAQPVFPPMAADTLQRQMIPPQTRDGYPTIQGDGVMPGPDGTYIAYGRGWANVSNTPFREYKHWVHEGGISTPLIAHWPAAVRRQGEFDSQPGHLIDLMATCVDVAGATYPTRFHDDQAIHPLEGRSLRPAFAGQPIERDAIFWEHEGNRAVRVGDWKLVAKGEQGPWELYNIEDDRTEMHDLADQHPERVTTMAARWQAYAERAYVLPLNPERFSDQTRFELSPGDNLSREQSPHLDGRELTIRAQLISLQDGVVVAQGGSADGYALYVDKGLLHFAVRHQGRLTTHAVAQKLPQQSLRVEVVVAADGTVTISVADLLVAAHKLPDSLNRMPIDGLQVSADLQGVVGDYKAPFRYQGEIKSVTITLGGSE